MGDCCVDAPRECFGAENDDLDNLLPSDKSDKIEYENIRSNWFPRLMEMVYIESETTPQPVLYSFIYGCPQSTAFQEDCMNYNDYKTVVHHIPVCHPDSSLLFNNRFCAACNGYRMEDTFSYYARVQICDRWLALNYNVEDLFEKSTGADDLYHLCPPIFTGSIPNACRATAKRMRIYQPATMNNQDTPHLACTSFVNPIVTKNDYGETIIRSNQFCLQNTSAPWHCYDNKVRPHTFSGNPNKTVVLWVDKFGNVVARPLKDGHDDTEINTAGTLSIYSPATISLSLSFTVYCCIWFNSLRPNDAYMRQ